MSKERRVAMRDGATKVAISVRRSWYTTTHTVTSSYHCGRTKRVARQACVAAGGAGAHAATAAHKPAAARAAANSAPRAARSARQRRSAERSARHHRREHWRRLWRKCILAVVAGRKLGRLLEDVRALRAESQSPSKRARDEAPGRAETRDSPETSRALVLVGEEEGDATRAAVASPKRPRVRPGEGLPCQWCGEELPGHARQCVPWSHGSDGSPPRSCAPSAEALAIAGWQHDRQP